MGDGSKFFIFRQVMAVELHCLSFESTLFADIPTKKLFNGFVVNK